MKMDGVGDPPSSGPELTHECRQICVIFSSTLSSIRCASHTERSVVPSRVGHIFDGYEI